MKKFTLALLCLFLLNSVFSQAEKNFAEDQMILKFKPESAIDFENCITSQKFGNAVLDALNEQFSVKEIQLTGNKKLGLTYVLKFEYNNKFIQMAPAKKKKK